MSTSSRVEPAPVAGTNVLHWVCTKNPFYAISAALVLWGLWVSFGNQTEEEETWWLMTGLASYTLLLAATALVLVRFLHLWEDARTVLLLIVLMFLATSVTFDHVLVLDVARGAPCYLIGFVLAVLISETVLRGIKLRLPALYRAPYYLILGLFFLYPLFARSLLDPAHPVQEPIMWALFGFASAAGLAFLTLLPALQKGADYLRENGSPLPWPLYPWSLFFILALAVPGRAVLMCWSLQSLGLRDFDHLVFGPYFLVPFVFVLGILMLELGLVLPKSILVRCTLGVPVVMVVLALVGHTPDDVVYRILRVMTVSIGDLRAFDEVRREPDPVYGQFLEMFSARLGADPLFWTVILAACFYTYAAWRRVPLASEGLSLTLASLALVATNSLSEGWLTPPEAGPLVAPAVLQLALGVRRRNVWNLFLGSVGLAGASALAMPLWETAPFAVRTGIFAHFAILAMLLLGAIYTDRHGLIIRCLGVTYVMLLALAVMYDVIHIPEGVPEWFQIVYPFVAGVVLAVYGRLLHHTYSALLGSVLLCLWVFTFGWTAYHELKRRIRGVDYILWGLGFFVVAILVSLGKAGTLQRWLRSVRGSPGWMRPTPSTVNVEPTGPHAEPGS